MASYFHSQTLDTFGEEDIDLSSFFDFHKLDPSKVDVSKLKIVIKFETEWYNEVECRAEIRYHEDDVVDKIKVCITDRDKGKGITWIKFVPGFAGEWEDCLYSAKDISEATEFDSSLFKRLKKWAERGNNIIFKISA